MTAMLMLVVLYAARALLTRRFLCLSADRGIE